MILGFSGTRDGLSKWQVHWVERLLNSFQPTALHHGACVGADEEIVGLVAMFFPQTTIHAHQPLVREFLSEASLYDSQILHPPKDYLVRNDDIVAACDLLIACPSPSSKGTRYTIQKARDSKKPVIVIEVDSMRAWL